jgi:hypothetical protein
VLARFPLLAALSRAIDTFKKAMSVDANSHRILEDFGYQSAESDDDEESSRAAGEYDAAAAAATRYPAFIAAGLATAGRLHALRRKSSSKQDYVTSGGGVMIMQSLFFGDSHPT